MSKRKYPRLSCIVAVCSGVFKVASASKGHGPTTNVDLPDITYGTQGTRTWVRELQVDNDMQSKLTTTVVMM